MGTHVQDPKLDSVLKGSLKPVVLYSAIVLTPTPKFIQKSGNTTQFWPVCQGQASGHYLASAIRPLQHTIVQAIRVQGNKGASGKTQRNKADTRTSTISQRHR